MEEERLADNLDADSDGISKEEEKLPDLTYKIILSQEYIIDGQSVKELDMSGLEDLTTIDAQELDRIMARLNHPIRGSAYRDTLYVKHLAMRVTGYNADFFNQLKMRDMEEIKSRVLLFFMYG